MNIKFGIIKDTGKEKFIERLMEEIPKGQEVKLTTEELERNNEDATIK